jgi:hypothetical protein
MFELVDQFREKVRTLYSTSHLQQKAVESGFYKRSSKLLPYQFFDILLYSASVESHCSLSQASCEINNSFGFTVSKQSIDERFNASAVKFVRSVFEKQLSNQINGSIEPEFLKKFQRVRIKDATRFDLPEHLKGYFKGYGGKFTSAAAVGIQYEYDIRNGAILDFDLTDAIRQDSTDAKEKTGDIQAGDLIIRDLGYFSSDVIKEIYKRNAYFVSRLNAKMLIYEPNHQEICFSKLYAWMSQHKISHLQKHVLMGKDLLMPARLVIDIVPEEIYQKRLKKIEASNRKKGHQTTNDYKARARFNLLVTNTENDQIEDQHLYQLYKLRWQIELIFKTWKSTYKIDKLHSMKPHRFICTLYAKLLLLLINHQIINTVQKRLFEQYRKILSQSKCFKTLLRHFPKTRMLLTFEQGQIKDFISDIASMFSKNHWLEKRRKRSNYEEIFELFI